jgi:hypothetical protein
MYVYVNIVLRKYLFDLIVVSIKCFKHIETKLIFIIYGGEHAERK